MKNLITSLLRTIDHQDDAMKSLSRWWICWLGGHDWNGCQCQTCGLLRDTSR